MALQIVCGLPFKSCARLLKRSAPILTSLFRPQSMLGMMKSKYSETHIGVDAIFFRTIAPGSGYGRQVDRKGRPCVLFTLDGDRAAHRLDQRVADRKVQPGAMADVLGREKGVEYLGNVV